MSTLTNLTELIEAEIISEETARKIQEYYNKKNESSSNRLFVAFGILGAMLVGLGIILIIAHNWDELSRVTKTIFSFLPLFIGQILSGVIILKKTDSTGLRESTSAFLFLSVGASISLIGQTYNIPGNVNTFLITWMLLCLPLIYLLKSSISSLLYLIGITYYSVNTGYWTYPFSESYTYWLLLLLSLPHYYLLFKENNKSNFLFFHHWFIPISVIICLGTVAKQTGELMYIAYFSLFGLLYLIGQLKLFNHQNLINNGYQITGSLGTILLLFALSFDWFWEDLRAENYAIGEIISTPEFLASLILSSLASVLLYQKYKNSPLHNIRPFTLVFILFIITFILGIYSSLAVVFINLIVFGLGILTILNGAKRNHLGILNYGLLIITVLVICRFFDTDLSFILRGMMFLSVGAGFFVTNYWMLKKRMKNE